MNEKCYKKSHTAFRNENNQLQTYAQKVKARRCKYD